MDGLDEDSDVVESSASEEEDEMESSDDNANVISLFDDMIFFHLNDSYFWILLLFLYLFPVIVYGRCCSRLIPEYRFQQW